jgi:hypothetical protein
MGAVTFGDYVKRLGTSVGGMALLGAALPLASIFPADWAAFLFPPLGDLTGTARVVCVVAVLIVICFGYVGIGVKTLKPWIVVATLVALLSACAYLYCSFAYVLKINTTNSFILVSIGSEKTDFANKAFTNGESVWEMVRLRGLDDEQITKIWTAQSVQQNRLKLCFTYFGAILCWAVIFSLATALEISSGATAPAPP